MNKRLLLPVLLLVIPVAACGLCLWNFFRLAGRDIGVVDIGGGRVVKIWSRESERDWPFGPVPIYYRIERAGVEVVSTTFLGVDRGQAFDFRTAFADGGRLACVYEGGPAAPPRLSIIYDAESGQSWPRLTNAELHADWLRRLRAENPSFPVEE